jgi:hypothetical protein
LETGPRLASTQSLNDRNDSGLTKPIPREEAIRIIEMNLALNGFSLVPAEGDIVEVVGINKNPRAAAVPIISDPADLPGGSQVVSYLFRLSYADPQELQQVLSQYLAGIGGQAPILALPKSSSLLVTQSADVLRKLVKMVEQIDVAQLVGVPDNIGARFIHTQHHQGAIALGNWQIIQKTSHEIAHQAEISRMTGKLDLALFHSDRSHAAESYHRFKCWMTE